MSELAAIHQTGGLPRGRGSLEPEELASAHRERIMRAAISAIAERGFAETRISDIVERARVSRSSFYALFADKEECFVAAYTHGLGLVLTRLTAWIADEADSDPLTQLESGVAAYLRLASDEPEFTRCALIELQAIGPLGLTARVSGHEQIAAIIKLWHASARRVHPGWPPIPVSRYAAAVGGAHDLLFAAVACGAVEPAALQTGMVDAITAILEIPAADSDRVAARPHEERIASPSGSE